jgi:hypothetical protein
MGTSKSKTGEHGIPASNNDGASPFLLPVLRTCHTCLGLVLFLPCSLSSCIAYFFNWLEYCSSSILASVRVCVCTARVLLSCG